MAVTDEDRARISDLTLRAFDATEEFGEDVNLEDAVVIFEVSYEAEDGEIYTELIAKTTTHRATVAGGIARAYAGTQLSEYVDRRDIEDD